MDPEVNMHKIVAEDTGRASVMEGFLDSKTRDSLHHAEIVTSYSATATYSTAQEKLAGDLYSRNRTLLSNMVGRGKRAIALPASAQRILEMDSKNVTHHKHRPAVRVRRGSLEVRMPDQKKKPARKEKSRPSPTLIAPAPPGAAGAGSKGGSPAHAAKLQATRQKHQETVRKERQAAMAAKTAKKKQAARQMRHKVPFSATNRRRTAQTAGGRVDARAVVRWRRKGTFSWRGPCPRDKWRRRSTARRLPNGLGHWRGHSRSGAATRI